ncbi:MAG: DUF4199 domain-containing protein [Bacteroidia bacterium]|nr:DUF4199 domain-containing protein [Bacteroidia bacterium]NND51580.1 DUF4199 domain-containing protein [Flavobacteriaceae bacterium]
MEKTLKSIAMNYGLYLGLALTLTTVLVYATNLDIFVKWQFSIALFLLVLIVGFISITKAKKAQGGFISFKEAFTSFFITVAVGTIISSVVGLIIFTIVDPEAAEQLNEKILIATKESMERFGAPDETIKEQLAKARDKDNFSIGTTLTNYVIGLVIYSIFGLIGAAIFKKKNADQD